MRQAPLQTTIAGSLPKPAWLAPPNQLWAPWRLEGETLAEGKRDATLLALRDQETAGIDIVTDGEQTRRHFVTTFIECLEGVDFQQRRTVHIRNRYDAEVPIVIGPVARRNPVFLEDAKFLRAQTRRPIKLTLPGPMTMVDTLHDDYYKSRERLAMDFAAILNAEARELERAGVDVIQFDEPAFNVYMDEVREWGMRALMRSREGLGCKTAVHICYGYGIKANIDWKNSLGGEWRQYEEIFPALAKSRVGQVSVECINSRVPLKLLSLLEGKDVLIGVIDVASDEIETAERVAQVIGEVTKFVPKEKIVACTNCGMAPMRRDIAEAKLVALGKGAELARQRFR